MRITVTGDGKNTNIVIPARLLLNKFAAKFMINRIPEDTVENLTPAAAKKLVKELNRFRRSHKDWVLVDVEDGKTGERVIIKL